MRIASALLLSAGAHLAALSVAGGPARPAVEAGEPVMRLAALHAVLADRRPAPAPAVREAPRPEAPLKVAEARTPPEAAPPRRYLALAELDSRPQIKSHVMPQYPEGVQPGTQGRVVLELLIGSDGRVEGVNVERAEPGGLFEEAAVKAFAKAVFSPGMRRGAPVPALLRIEVYFGD